MNSKNVSEQQLDEDILLSYYEGLPKSAMLRALDLYLQEGKKHIQALRHPLTDTQGYRHYHTLKTMSRMVGAGSFASLCETLETIAADNDQYNAIRHELFARWDSIETEVITLQRRLHDVR